MVQILNSPQTQIPVREDPLLDPFAQMAAGIINKINANKASRSAMAATSTEQMQKLIPDLIKSGATPQEAAIAASKMVAQVKPQDEMKPATFDMPFMSGSINMPNVANIAQNAWSMMKSPETTAPNFAGVGKFKSQKTLKERGVDTKPFGDFSSMMSGFNPEEAKQMEPIVSAFLKVRKSNTMKQQPDMLSLAVKSVENEIKENPTDTIDNPEWDRDEAIYEKFQMFTNIKAGKGTGKPKKDASGNKIDASGNKPAGTGKDDKILMTDPKGNGVMVPSGKVESMRKKGYK